MAGRVTLALLAAAIVCAWPAAAGATVITVNTTTTVFPTGTSDDCTIYEAFKAADTNTASGAGANECPAGSTSRDTIVIPAGTYTIANQACCGEALPINGTHGPVTVQGAGAAVTTITRDPASMGRIFTVRGAGGHVIQGLTLTGAGIAIPADGSDMGWGGAVTNTSDSELTIDHCVLTDNQPQATFTAGGAVANSGTLTVVDSTFSNNTAGTPWGASGTVTGTAGGDSSPGGTGGNATGSTNAAGGKQGGAIYNSGVLLVERSLFTGNHATDGADGQAAVGGHGGNGVASGSFGGAGGNGSGGAGGTGGRGGAIAHIPLSPTSTLTVVDSTFIDNAAGNGGDGGAGTGGAGGNGVSGTIGQAGNGGAGGVGTGGTGGVGGAGGAIYVQTDEQYGAAPAVVIENSLFTGNLAGEGGAGGVGTGGAGGNAGTAGAIAGVGGTGGAGNGGAAARGGDGGGLNGVAVVNASPGGHAFPTFRNATITANSAGPAGAAGAANGGLGGANSNPATRAATGSATPGAGSTRGSGGGLAVDGLTGFNLTVSANTGAGISADGTAPVVQNGGTQTLDSVGSLTNSIVVLNTNGNCDFPSGKAFLLSNISFPLPVSCEGIVSNPNLQPLADNGGPTQTQALGLGSVAIDYGYGPACSATDQRGVGRPQLAGCDVGAYEVAPPSVTTGPASSVTTGAASLGGSVNPNQRASSYHFEYGVTDSYGSSTATKNLAAGNAPVGVSADLGGLTPSTTYHYRVVASNADGSSTGADQTFTTGAAGGGSGDDSTPPAPTGSSDPTGTDPTGPSTSTTTTTATTDRVAPTLRSVTFAPLKLRKSATLKFSLSEPAKVAIVIKRGKKVVARIAMSGKSGANRRKVARKIGRRTLKVGRYVLALQATDPAGNKSSLKQIKFRVVR